MYKLKHTSKKSNMHNTQSNSNQLIIPGYRQHMLEGLATEYMTDSGRHNCQRRGLMQTLSAGYNRQL